MINTVRSIHFARLNQKPHPAIGWRWEIDASLYNEFAEMFCPPLEWTENSFYNPEFETDDLTTKYTKDGSRYFCEFANYPGGRQAMLDEEEERSRRLFG